MDLLTFISAASATVCLGTLFSHMLAAQSGFLEATVRTPRILVGLAIALVATCIVLLAPALRAGSPQEDREHAAIRAVLSGQQNAWNRGDVAAFMQGYWNSPQLSFASSSGFVRGWDKVTNRYKQNYPDRASMGKLDFSDLEVHTLGPDAALVLGKWHLQRASADVGGIFSLVFQRFPEGWLIVHDHTSVVANPAK
jgi:ketosteroid isomerase-like protein